MGRVTVRVIPRASREALEGFDAADRLKVRLTAPPVEGAANAALVKLLAARLGVARGRVRVVLGGGGRTKVIEVEGYTDTELRDALAT